MKEDKIPKVFISYSWSSDNITMPLAERLVSHGIDVVLDQWDLKEGQDKYVFMEQCVNDPEIDKVLIVCNQKYAERANNREGGVGDETAIISTEIYGKVKQEKFIPIIADVMRRVIRAFLPILNQEFILIYQMRRSMKQNMRNCCETYMKNQYLRNLNWD